MVDDRAIGPVGAAWTVGAASSEREVAAAAPRDADRAAIGRAAATLEELRRSSRRRGVSAGPSEIRRPIERAADASRPCCSTTRGRRSKRVRRDARSPLIDPDLHRRVGRGERCAASSTSRAAAPTSRSRPAARRRCSPFYLAFARLARISGGDVADDDDSGPLRVDGRAAPRGLRWVDGVAVVTDGESLCATRGAEPPQEWLFLMPRPALVVADGPFAEVAVEAGHRGRSRSAGLEHCSLAVGGDAAAGATSCRCAPTGAGRLPALIEARSRPVEPALRPSPTADRRRPRLTSPVASRRRTARAMTSHTHRGVDPRQLRAQRRTLAPSG